MRIHAAIFPHNFGIDNLLNQTLNLLNTYGINLPTVIWWNKLFPAKVEKLGMDHLDRTDGRTDGSIQLSERKGWHSS